MLTQWRRRSVQLIMLLVVASGCAPDFDNSRFTPPPPPKTECPKALLQEASDLYRDLLLYEFRPETRKGAELRYRRVNRPLNMEYYYQLNLIGERSLRFREKFIKAYCYVDKNSEKRFGTDLVNLENQIRGVLTPLGDLVNFQFSLHPALIPVGILSMPCMVAYKPQRGGQQNSEQAEKANRANEFLIDQLANLTEILNFLKTEVTSFRNHNYATYSNESLDKFVTYINYTEFFCRAYTSLDGNNECTNKDAEILKFCEDSKDFLFKMQGDK